MWLYVLRDEEYVEEQEGRMGCGYKYVGIKSMKKNRDEL